MSEHNINLYQIVKSMRLYFNTLEYRTPHFHSDIEVMWVLEGSMNVQIGNDICSVHEGEMILVNPEQPHEIKTTGTSCTLLGFHISSELVAEDVPDFAHIQFDEYFLNHLPKETYTELEHMLLDVAWQYLKNPPFYELYCRSQMRLFVHTLLCFLPHRFLTEEQSQIQKNHNARLKRLIQFVKMNYMNNIRLADFAESEGCSLSHISHFVQNTMHRTFRQYVEEVRYNAACKMMITGKYKMLDICMECGFSDYRYFSKAFVNRTGLTPELYGHTLSEKVGDETLFKHSIHSSERFYTPEESLELLDKFSKLYKQQLCNRQNTLS